MKIRNYDKEHEKIELQMTPMIDIVFQLLVFFIMTFKIVTQEGDFNIKMPLSEPDAGAPIDTLPPLKVRLQANSTGILSGVFLNETSLGGSTAKEKFDQLHIQILDLIGGDIGPESGAEEAEVEFSCDYDLHYEYVIQAITSVSGYVGQDGSVIKLIEKIRFAAPRESGGGL